ncbi:MAG: RNA methyltransferase [Bacteroidetes bacterium]|nr:RNA methyltransferase [Bacteroidota bacterium]
MRKLQNSELNRLDVEAFKKENKLPIVIVLDNVRSLHNVGAIFRTSDAFLIQKIYLCGITGTPPNKEIRKTALGATETVCWEYASNTLELVKKLQGQGIYVASLEQAVGSVMLQDFEPIPARTMAFVFGHEVHGVSQEVVDASDKVIEIPQFGSKHSLNVSVSAGMVIWELFKKLKT